VWKPGFVKFGHKFYVCTRGHIYSILLCSQLPSNEPQDLPASAVGSQTTVDQQTADDNNEESTSPVAPAPTETRTSKQQVQQDKKPDKKYVVHIPILF